MGSDTCASIRIPASHNSLVGIRGTQGLASRSGIIPLSSTQDIGGPIARTVTDLAIMLDATVGYDPTDPQTAASVDNIPRSYTDDLQLTALHGARIGLLSAMLGTDPADAEVAAVVRGAVEEMKWQGAEIVEVSIPDLSELLTDRANGVPHHPTGFQVRPERLSGGASERSGTDSGRGARLRQVPPRCRDELA